MVAAGRSLLLPESRLVLDAPAAPRVRLRVWEADGPDPRAFRPGAHREVELSWVMDGTVGYVIGGERFDVGAQSAMLVPSEVEHQTLFPTAMHSSSVWVDRDLVAELSETVGRDKAPAIGVVPGAARIAALGAVLADEARAADRGALLAADAIVEAMLIIALRGQTPNAAGSSAPNDPAIAAAVRLIEAEYAQPLTVDAMARAARMSRFHFSRRFRDATKRSPYQFLMDVRIERAAELLRRGGHSVTEASMSVGFSDPGRFARAFRARFGGAPGAYAAEVRARTVVSLPVRAARVR